MTINKIINKASTAKEQSSFNISTISNGNHIHIILSGQFLTKQFSAISKKLKTILSTLSKNSSITQVIAEDLQIIDSNIAWYLRRQLFAYQPNVQKVKLSGFTSEQEAVFELLPLVSNNAITYNTTQQTYIQAIKSIINYLAVMYIKFFQLSYAVLFESIPSNKSQLKQMWTSVLAYSQEFGFKGLPVFGLTMFFLGIVLSFQAAYQLKTFAADLLTVDFLAVSVFRELGPLFTGILLASRSGSSISSQIGAMKINQEIDILKVMNLKPVASIVWPQVVSITLISPLLATYSIFMALIGGWMMFITYLDQSTSLYIDLLYRSVSTSSIVMFLWKTPLFAFCTGIISCMQGLEVKSDTVDIGKRTTAAVVTSLITILTLDGILSLITTYLDW